MISTTVNLQVCCKEVLLKVNVSFKYNGIQYLGSLKRFYTSPPGKHVHSNANSTYLGKIQSHCNYHAKTIRSHAFSAVYSYYKRAVIVIICPLQHLVLRLFLIKYKHRKNCILAKPGSSRNYRLMVVRSLEKALRVVRTCVCAYVRTCVCDTQTDKTYRHTDRDRQDTQTCKETDGQTHRQTKRQTVLKTV